MIAAAWADFPWSPLITIGALVLSVAMLAMDERNRRKFASREEMTGLTTRLDKDIDGVGRKVDRNAGLYVGLDDRVGDLEEKTSLLEERQSQQWERISEQMAGTAKTIESVALRLERISEMQQQHALRLERLHQNGG